MYILQSILFFSFILLYPIYFIRLEQLIIKMHVFVVYRFFLFRVKLFTLCWRNKNIQVHKRKRVNITKRKTNKKFNMHAIHMISQVQ